jgi:hypothetical protein
MYLVSSSSFSLSEERVLVVAAVVAVVGSRLDTSDGLEIEIRGLVAGVRGEGSRVGGGDGADGGGWLLLLLLLLLSLSVGRRLVNDDDGGWLLLTLLTLNDDILIVLYCIVLGGVK